MANREALPGDILLVVHDFVARSPDELSLKRGERIELIERDDDFGDGWFLGRHLSREDSGLFPEVYTTPAPKPTSAVGATRRLAAQQAASGASGAYKGIAELSEENNIRAPSVQPPGSEVAQSSHFPSDHAVPLHPAAERSFSAPLTNLPEPDTPPNALPLRPGQTSVAQRSISMSNGTHQNSPVMNETLSVIEEHITDLSTPRSSLLLPDGSSINREGLSTGQAQERRLSYINGHETEEEESGMLTENEVREWGPDRVAEYLGDIGVEQHHCKVFQEQEISGDVLLGMDQGSLMLKEFELGSIGKRLALWQKIKALQEEVRISGAVPRGGGGVRFAANGPLSEQPRNRSTSVGTVLPRIPSLMESGSRSPSRQGSLRSPSKTHTHYNDSVSSMPAMEAQHGGHTPRPSAASIRELYHNRRHSSIDQIASSPTTLNHTESPIAHRHNKQGSLDQTWTMGGIDRTPAQHTPQDLSLLGTPEPPTKAPTPTDHGMLVVNSLDLDRGYFSGNEIDNRNKRNVLKKKATEPPTIHGRAPSDSYGNKRLSAVFRSRRSGSTDSISDLLEPSATTLFYGKSNAKSRTMSGPQISNHAKHSSMSPTVTKLDYGDSPSIDAVATSPHVAGSETSSIERPAPKNMFSHTRVTGLRAISDAITGDEKKLAISPTSAVSATSEKDSTPAKESPLQSPGSSTPSINSRSLELDDSSILKSSTAGSGGRQTPIIPRRKGKKSTSAYTRGLLQKSPKEQMIACDYSGWMKKKSSNLMTTWKTRLFVLRGTRLSYYYTEDDTEEKGLIDISFHRVLPANNDRITGLHAAFTGASASPTSPQNAQIQTAASQDAQKAGQLMKGDDSGMFIFKLVPPRAGLPKAVNFTKPTVHYFAVDNIQQGRLWMAALMKATIERDDAHQVITTYKEKTISLAKAKAMRQRPPALMGDDEETNQGLRISFMEGDTDAATVTTNGDREGSFTTGEGTENASSEDVAKAVSNTTGT